MNTVLDVIPDNVAQDGADKPLLLQVWIDLNFGQQPSDWWWNSPPKPAKEALQEATEARAGGWTVVITPEGQNPRADGRWDNP